MTWGSVEEPHECNRCGEMKPCEYVVDPYLNEINTDGRVYECAWWCEDCFDTRAGDI